MDRRNPLEEEKRDLFHRLRRIAGNYGGPGETIEDSLMGLWKNPEAAHIRSELLALGVADWMIESEAFRRNDDSPMEDV
jgi:hypothetical protein